MDVDLFDQHEQQPPALAAIVEKHMGENESLSYEECADFLSAVQEIGFTFDYELDGMPFNLRPIETGK